MSLVGRFSVFFLLALALALGGFSICLYALASAWLQKGFDQELKLAMDHIKPGSGPDDSRVGWALLGPDPEDAGGWAAGWSRPPFGIELVLLSSESLFDLEGEDGVRYRVMTRGPDAMHRGHPGPPPPEEERFRDRPTAPITEGPSHRPAAERRSTTPSREDQQAGPRINQENRPPSRGGPESTTRPGSNPEDRRGGRGRGWGLRRPPLLTVWRPLNELQADLTRLTFVLSAVSITLWAAAAAIGRHFGRRALAPIKQLAEYARVMPVDNRSERLPSPGTDDELEQFAAEFNSVLDRLHEALERQKQFTAQASHQLRTPLAGLIATLEVARRRSRSVSYHERILDQLHTDALRLWRIIEALLFLARADAEAALPELEAIELGAWLELHLAPWRQHPRAGDFLLHPTTQPITLEAHPALLGQLLDNLLENACKYSAIGSFIEISTHTSGHHAVIEVKDAGRGIAAADLNRIFDPFFRSESVCKQGLPGVGLGLAVARRIARTMGGDLTVTSEPGRGSTFSIRLRLARQISQHLQPSQTETAAPVA